MSDTVPDLAGVAEAADSAAGIIGPNIPAPLPPAWVSYETTGMIGEAKVAEQHLNTCAIAKNSVAALLAKAKAQRAALGHDPAAGARQTTRRAGSRSWAATRRSPRMRTKQRPSGPPAQKPPEPQE